MDDLQIIELYFARDEQAIKETDNVPLTMEDEASNSIALLNVVIEETAEGYTARIDSFTVYEKTTNPAK